MFIALLLFARGTYIRNRGDQDFVTNNKNIVSVILIFKFRVYNLPLPRLPLRGRSSFLIRHM